MAELVLKLRVAGDRDVDAALSKLGQAAQEAGVKLQPLKDPALANQSRQAASALSGLSRTLSGTAALLSVVSRGNKDLQDTFEKVTVALAIGSTALSVYSNVTQLATVKAVGLSAAAKAMWAAMLGPVGVLIALSTAALALGVALGALIVRKREASEQTNKFVDSIRGAEERTQAFRASLDQLTSTVKSLGVSVETQVFVQWTNLALAAADATKRFGLQLEGLLGQTAVFGIVTPESVKKAEAATREAAERAKKLREEAMRTILDLLRLANQQTIELIEQEEKAAIEAGQRVLEAERQLAAETASLVQLANAQAIAAIEAREQEALESTARMLEAGRQFANETAALIAISNLQAIEAIEAEEQARLAAGQRMVDAAAAAAESARQAWINAVADIVVRAKSLAEVMEGIWEFIKQTIIRKMAEALADKVWNWAKSLRLSQILPFPFNIVAGVFGLQQGGIVTRPTVAALAEGGRPEAVIPLDRMGSMLGREVNIHLHGAAFLGSQEDARKWFQATLGPVLRQEFAR